MFNQHPIFMENKEDNLNQNNFSNTKNEFFNLKS